MLSFIPPFVEDHLEWFVGGLIVVIGLFVIGWRDVLRFSATRVWAISSVSFAESIRRRVLWITPLAILGVIIVSQLQKPLDEQDAIRQTIKFSLFATALVVTIATIILACTNLPREIDNRVIFTVVTKPATRLELVLGKILGFARVSAAILLIMGLFTWGYLHLRAYNMRNDIRARLESAQIDAPSRAALSYYAQPGGLLNARALEYASGFDIYSRLPRPGENVRWMGGGYDGDMLVPFDLTLDDLVAFGDPTNTPGGGGLVIEAQLAYERRALTTEELEQAPSEEMMEQPSSPSTLPSGPLGPPAPSIAPPAATLPQAGADAAATDDRPKMLMLLQAQPAPATQPLPPPMLEMQVMDENFYNVITTGQTTEGSILQVPMSPPGSNEPARALLNPTDTQKVVDAIRPALAGGRPGRIYIRVQGPTVGVDYAATDKAVRLIVPGVAGMRVIEPAKAPNGATLRPLFRGRRGAQNAQQLRSPSAGQDPIAVYEFRNVDVSPTNGQVPFELRVGIERSGREADTQGDDVTQAYVEVFNTTTNQTSEPIPITPETIRRTHFSVPASMVDGGSFDVRIRNTTPGHYIGLRPSSLLLVSGSQPFALNLFKSLLIMWLMSLLVIIVSIFASTFLSWPIAIVLTLVILLGRWGVDQLGESIGPGIGNQVATELGFRGAAQSKVVSESVEALSKMLRYVSAVLPDISKFAATEDIEQGASIRVATIVQSLMVIVTFGLPVVVLSYVFLRNKEVAP